MEGFWTGFSEFHFIRPWWLLGLVYVVWFWIKSRLSPPLASIDQLVDKHLQSVVVDAPVGEASDSLRFLPQLLIGLLCVSLAGPAWQRLPQPLYQLQQGRVLLLSLSETMDAKDILPSRLKRAQFKLGDLLESMPGVLTGLIGFAGEAFVVAPLSDDRETVLNLLNSLDTKTLPVQGYHGEKGLQKAADLLAQVGVDSGEVIIIADRISPLTVTEAAGLYARGIRVSVLSLAPSSDKDQQALFERIALSGGGVFSQLTSNDADIEHLNAPTKNWLVRAKTKSSQSQRKADQWRDIGPYMLLPILLLSSLLFRRGWLIVTTSVLVPFMLMFSWPKSVSAFELENLWRRVDQIQYQAAEAYRAQDYQSALEGFGKDESAQGNYNQANALARLGKLPEAITAYDRALAKQADFEDAQYNRDLVQAALDKEKEQQQQQQESEQENNSDEQQDAQKGEGSEQDQAPDQEGQANQDDKEGKSQSDGEDKKSNSKAQGEAGETPPMPLGEDEQTLQMMLRQVPDDPGALLRRKFARQYSKSQSEPAGQSTK